MNFEILNFQIARERETPPSFSALIHGAPIQDFDGGVRNTLASQHAVDKARFVRKNIIFIVFESIDCRGATTVAVSG